MPYNEPGSTYTVLKFPEDVHSTIISLPTTLRFIAHDCDPTTGIPDTEQGYHDEYMVMYIFITGINLENFVIVYSCLENYLVQIENIFTLVSILFFR